MATINVAIQATKIRSGGMLLSGAGNHSIEPTFTTLAAGNDYTIDGAAGVTVIIKSTSTAQTGSVTLRGFPDSKTERTGDVVVTHDPVTDGDDPILLPLEPDGWVDPATGKYLLNAYSKPSDGDLSIAAVR